MTNNKGKSYCRTCGNDTNHDVLAEHSASHRDEYACDIHYEVGACRGGETQSFRKVFVDIESAFPISDQEGDVPKDIDVYPKTLTGHVDISHAHHIPDVVARKR